MVACEVVTALIIWSKTDSTVLEKILRIGTVSILGAGSNIDLGDRMRSSCF